MRQDKLDDEIIDLYSKMDPHDDAASLARRESIWENLDVNRTNRKKHRKLWLLLLLCPIFFAAGWFFRTPQAAADTFFHDTKDVKAMDEKPNLNIALTDAQRGLDLANQMIDSLRILNEELLSIHIKNTNEAKVDRSSLIQKIYVTDTLYLTEIKVEERIVERVIRDTIRIKVPAKNEIEHPLAEGSATAGELDPSQKPDNTSIKARSVQFNFSEANVHN